jgi:hypothetical protein
MKGGEEMEEDLEEKLNTVFVGSILISIIIFLFIVIPG